MKMKKYSMYQLPKRIDRLYELAHNLWFSWHSNTLNLFRMLDGKLWENVEHNPIRLLQNVDSYTLERMSQDEKFLDLYDTVMTVFDHYLNDKDTWFATQYPEFKDKTIAYFSMEFGMHESMPIYSGGLGILSGDHLKSASDLGIPLVGVGLLYRESYFIQQIAPQGQQQCIFEHNDYSQLALQPVVDDEGNEIIVSIPVNNHSIHVRAWISSVGRIPLILLDSDFPANTNGDREITNRLYVGSRDKRLLQEIILGIGGVAMLKKMGIDPAVWHMNEGHSAILVLERIRRFVKRGMALDEAMAYVKKTTGFTTHTPVPAGNEIFHHSLIDRYLSDMFDDLGMTRDDFLELARNPGASADEFNMTVLALKMSNYANGVSKLHGQVSRKMWHSLWPDTPQEQVPIFSITNGIHSRTWLASQIKQVFDDTVGEAWRYKQTHPDFWKFVDTIPNESLWRAHSQLKSLLIDAIRDRLVTKYVRNGEEAHVIDGARQILNPQALTIGFARRFATYKRATLIFKDRERLKYLLNLPGRPVQLIFSGKAHPADRFGQDLIRQIYMESRHPDFFNKIVFVENYDMAISKRLVTGVDVWLNNPRRPLEASGTSGMKVAINGGLNFSILDGWWEEGFTGKNGWAIGKQVDYHDMEQQDYDDSMSLYDTLEHQIIPLYYERNENQIPDGWVEMMKRSIQETITFFNTDRMLKEYTRLMYAKALKNDK